jgi:hypothetical protein
MGTTPVRVVFADGEVMHEPEWGHCSAPTAGLGGFVDTEAGRGVAVGGLLVGVLVGRCVGVALGIGVCVEVGVAVCVLVAMLAGGVTVMTRTLSTDPSTSTKSASIHTGSPSMQQTRHQVLSGSWAVISRV